MLFKIKMKTVMEQISCCHEKPQRSDHLNPAMLHLAS